MAFPAAMAGSEGLPVPGAVCMPMQAGPSQLLPPDRSLALGDSRSSVPTRLSTPLGSLSVPSVQLPLSFGPLSAYPGPRPPFAALGPVVMPLSARPVAGPAACTELSPRGGGFSVPIRGEVARMAQAQSPVSSRTASPMRGGVQEGGPGLWLPSGDGKGVWVPMVPVGGQQQNGTGARQLSPMGERPPPTSPLAPYPPEHLYPSSAASATSSRRGSNSSVAGERLPMMAPYWDAPGLPVPGQPMFAPHPVMMPVAVPLRNPGPRPPQPQGIRPLGLPPPYPAGFMMPSAVAPGAHFVTPGGALVPAASFQVVPVVSPSLSPVQQSPWPSPHSSRQPSLQQLPPLSTPTKPLSPAVSFVQLPFHQVERSSAQPTPPAAPLIAIPVTTMSRGPPGAPVLVSNVNMLSSRGGCHPSLLMSPAAVPCASVVPATAATLAAHRHVRFGESPQMVFLAAPVNTGVSPRLEARGPIEPQVPPSPETELGQGAQVAPAPATDTAEAVPPQEAAAAAAPPESGEAVREPGALTRASLALAYRGASHSPVLRQRLTAEEETAKPAAPHEESGAAQEQRQHKAEDAPNGQGAADSTTPAPPPGGPAGAPAQEQRQRTDVSGPAEQQDTPARAPVRLQPPSPPLTAAPAAPPGRGPIVYGAPGYAAAGQAPVYAAPGQTPVQWQPLIAHPQAGRPGQPIAVRPQAAPGWQAGPVHPNFSVGYLPPTSSASQAGTVNAAITKLLTDRDVLKMAVLKSFQKVTEGTGTESLDIQGLARFREELSNEIHVPREAFGDILTTYICFDFDGSGTLEVNEVYKLVKFNLKDFRKKSGGADLQVNIPHKSLSQAGFTVVKELGRGSQGVVQLVQDTHGRQLCVKCLSKVNMCSLGVAEMCEEFEVLQNLACDNIAQVYDIFQDTQFYYMVGEAYMGGDLTTLKARARAQGVAITEQWYKQVFRQCAEALEFMHEQAMMHCDIKEPNIMVQSPEYRDPQVVIIDFGICKAMAQPSNGFPTGTPGYMPPETIVERKWYPRGDIFCLGVVMLQVVIDKIPPQGARTIYTPGGIFVEGCQTVEDIWRATQMRQPPFHLVQPPMPGLVSLLQKMLTKSMQLRPTGLQVLNEPWFEERPVGRPATPARAVRPRNPFASIGITKSFLAQYEASGAELPPAIQAVHELRRRLGADGPPAAEEQSQDPAGTQ